MRKHKAFRAWFYFRNGWSLYFAFIFAAVNTLTVTYYLAIERLPSLQTIFPTFFQYVLIVTLIGIPLLILVGYAHWKRTAAYRSEADIWLESNPYQRRMVVNSEILLKLNLELIKILTKLTNNEKPTKDELDKMIQLHNEIMTHVNNRTFTNKKDLEYFRKHMDKS